MWITACGFLFSSCLSLASTSTTSEKQNSIITSHGFAQWGDLKYPADFKHFNFVNPNAPKGATLRLMGFGSYDSLNPYTLKGISPFNSPGMFMYGFTELNETLLAGTGNYLPSGDEPQSAYGLIAESISYPQDFSWVIFKLRPQAKFHDQHPIDAEDVTFSYEILTTKGHPRFQQTFAGVKSVESISKSEVRFTFKEPGRAANILRAGELPVLPSHFWNDKDFEKSSSITPLLSGPYKVGKFKIGQSLTLERVKKAWFKDVNGDELNIYKGRFNFDTIVIDFYRDQAVAFEGFKSGNFDLFYDYTAKNWAKAYDFPAIKDKRVIKQEITHQIPSPTQAFFFNTRRTLFKDKRVREALSLMFDFEWTNKALFNGAYKRNNSFFPNSNFSAIGAPEPREKEVLAQLTKDYYEYFESDPLSSDKINNQAFMLNVTGGNGNIRKAQRKALKLLFAAGWEIKQGKLTHTISGEVFEFEILIRQAGLQRIVMPYIKNLQKIGIKASPRLIDVAQYKVRIDQFDFDMTTASLSQGQAPSYELRDLFHSSTSSIEGSRNYAGIQNTVIDEVIQTIISSTKYDTLRTNMKILDRLLLWEHYTIPHWHLNYHRIAYWDRFKRPAIQAPFILGTDTWWIDK